MNDLFELIKLNSSNEEYTIGDAFLELFPIDFFKPSELGGSSVLICSEEDEQLIRDLSLVFAHIADLISDKKIFFSQKYNKDIIGSYGMMHPMTDPMHVERQISIRTHLNVWDIMCSHYCALES